MLRENPGDNRRNSSPKWQGSVRRCVGRIEAFLNPCTQGTPRGPGSRALWFSANWEPCVLTLGITSGVLYLLLSGLFPSCVGARERDFWKPFNKDPCSKIPVRISDLIFWQTAVWGEMKWLTGALLYFILLSFPFFPSKVWVFCVPGFMEVLWRIKKWKWAF